MHYYPHDINKFRAGTHNFTKLERWIYRDMLDIYYDTEQPLPTDFDQLCDLIGTEGNEESAAVSRVLRRKFTLAQDGYHHHICDAEIAAYKMKAESAKENGKKSAATRYQNGEYMPVEGTLYAVRFSPDKVKVGVSGNIKSRLNQLRNKYGKQAYLLHTVQVSHMGDAEWKILDIYAELRTGEEILVPTDGESLLVSHMDAIEVAYRVASGSHTNQESELRIKKSSGKRGIRLADDWHPTPEDTAFCKAERPDLRPSEVAARFFDYWTAQAGAKGVKLDWSAVWRNWVRNEKRLPPSQQPPDNMRGVI